MIPREVEPLLPPGWLLLTEETHLLETGPDSPLLPGLGDGVSHFFLDLQQRASFTGQLHLVEDDFDEMAQQLRLELGHELLEHLLSPGIGSAQTKFDLVILGRSCFSPIS